MSVTIVKGTITFKDETGKGSGKVVVTDKAATATLTGTKLDTLAAAIAAKSDCNLHTANFMTVKSETLPDPLTGLNDRKGVLVCIEPNGTVHKWEIPGIKAADCEAVKNSGGERIKAASAATLAAAFATALGLTLTPLECPVIQKR